MSFPEPDLQDAAANCYVDLLPTQQTATLAKSTRQTTLNFCAALKATFPADQPAGFPVLDLLAVLAAQAQNLVPIAGGNVTFPADLPPIVFTLYKVLWLTEILSDPTFGFTQISTAQGAAVLAAFNSAFAI